MTDTVPSRVASVREKPVVVLAEQLVGDGAENDAGFEEEQTLGRIGRQITALNIATLLLGACHQRVFMIHLLGHDPFDKTDQHFAEELVQGLITSILPT